jgi:site-specific DNA-methyltransferase (cytosine-N4-specific)
LVRFTLGKSVVQTIRLGHAHYGSRVVRSAVTKKSEIPFGATTENSGLIPQEPFRQSLSQILDDLKSSNKHVKGKALEMLAIYLIHLIDLDFKGWLLRSADSNGIEVEMIADDRLVPFNRWQIQCRNASRVDMGEIATAVGRSVFFKPNVVLSVTTGSYTSQARYYATRAMQLTSLQILLMDGQDLEAMAADEKMIESIIRREAEQIKAAKQPQLTSTWVAYV